MMAILLELLFGFCFYYPLFMSYMWMTGAVFYYWRYERHESVEQHAVPELSSLPGITIVVPCFNEGNHVREVIENLMNMRYPTYEVIAINDGSKDNTGDILNELTLTYPRLRVVHQAENQGKAIGLNTAAVIAKYQYLLCIDGDAIPDHYAIQWMLQHFEHGGRVGAVTGNPRIRTRSTLLGRLQVGEFSSIIGLIKRAQRTYSRLFTVSGVMCMFNRRALHDVGYWSPEMLTEDIDISWKLQMRHWDIRFEPHALCWILMPETLRGLWKQRLRWASGGIQVIFKYWSNLFKWRHRRMWPVFFEYATSVFWSYVMTGVFVLWMLNVLHVPLPPRLHIDSIIPSWHGLLIGTTCLLQFLLSMLIDNRYDRGIWRFMVNMIWYPIAFWLLTMLTTVVAVPKMLFRQKGKRARWVSPDRGVQAR